MTSFTFPKSSLNTKRCKLHFSRLLTELCVDWLSKNWRFLIIGSSSLTSGCWKSFAELQSYRARPAYTLLSCRAGWFTCTLAHLPMFFISCRLAASVKVDSLQTFKVAFLSFLHSGKEHYNYNLSKTYSLSCQNNRYMILVWCLVFMQNQRCKVSPWFLLVGGGAALLFIFFKVMLVVGATWLWKI